VYDILLKKRHEKRAAKKDHFTRSRFNDQLVTRFVNNLMWDGKKSTAFKVFYDAIDIIESKTRCRKTIIRNLEDALTNVMPHVEVRSRRVGGATQIQCKFVQTEKFLWQ
jgi:small subunit ribosomal protein S7